MTAPSFVASAPVQYGVRGQKSVVGLLTVPTTSTGGTALSAGLGGTFPQLHGLKRVDMLDAKTSLGYTPSFTEADVKIHGHKASGGGSTTELLNDVKGGVFANHLTDQASEGVNAHYVMAATAGNDATLNGAGVTAGLTAPDLYGRNLNLGLGSVGGATAVAGNVTVTGTFTDGTTTAVFAIVPGAIAAGKFRNRVGTKVCLTVTRVQCDTPQPADILISIGLGTVVGLSKAYAADGDVKAVKKNTANVAGFTASAAKQSVDPGADLADNDDLEVQYNSSQTNLVDTEAAAAANLGTIRVRGVGW